MKSLLLLLLSSTSFAFPSVGDYTYLTTADGYSKEAEIVSYDSTTKLYQAKYTDRIHGKVSAIEYRKLSGIEGMTSQWIDVVLQHCEDWYGGTSETVELPLGNFESCWYHDHDTGEYYNMGHVPFGVLIGDLYTSDGQRKEYTMQKYRFGN